MSGTSSASSAAQAGDQVTMDTLRAQHPNLVEQIRQEGVAAGEEQGKEAGFKSGQEAERQRVLEILDAKASTDITRTAVESGKPAADVYRMIVEADRDDKTAGLEDLKNDLKSAGQSGESAAERQKQSAGTDPQTEVLTRAADMARDKGISMAEAQKQVLKDNPELRKRYNASLLPG